MCIGSIYGYRSIIKAPSKSRTRCYCGCKTRATHIGLGDGVALTMGCEFHVRVWVRDGIELIKRAKVLKELNAQPVKGSCDG